MTYVDVRMKKAQKQDIIQNERKILYPFLHVLYICMYVHVCTCIYSSMNKIVGGVSYPGHF